MNDSGGYTSPVSYLGDQVKALRDKRGWSLDELAKRSGVDKQTIHRIEKGGNTRHGTIVKLAAGLSVSRAKLLDDPRLLETVHESADRGKGVEVGVADRLADLFTYIQSLQEPTRGNFIRGLSALLAAIEHARPAAVGGTTENDGR